MSAKESQYPAAASAVQQIILAIKEIRNLEVIDPADTNAACQCSSSGTFPDLVICNSSNPSEKAFVKAQALQVDGDEDDFLLCARRLDKKSPLRSLDMRLGKYFNISTGQCNKAFEFRTRVREGLLFQLFDAACQHASLDGLSSQALIGIATFLTAKDTVSLMKTNRHIHNILSEDEPWRQLLARDFPSAAAARAHLP